MKIPRGAKLITTLALAIATLFPTAQPAAADPILVWGATQEPVAGTPTREVFQRIDSATGAVLQSVDLSALPAAQRLGPSGATGAGLAIVNGRLLACAGNITDRRVVCLDARDGSVVGAFNAANLGGTFPHGFAIGTNPGLAMLTDPNADQAVIVDIAQSLLTGQAVAVSNVVSTCAADAPLRFDIRGGATGLNGEFYVTGAFNNGQGFLSKGFLVLNFANGQLTVTRRVARTGPAGQQINAGPLDRLCAVGANQINPTGATGSLNNVLLLEDTGPGGSLSVRRVDPNTGADLGQQFVAAGRAFDALTESFDQATGRVTSQPPPPVVPPGQNPPAVSGGAGVSCASQVGQTCTAGGNVSGTWTKGATGGTFTFTATGPINTMPGGTPAIFLSTTRGIESFPCLPVPFAPPFTTTCSGTTAGDILQNSTVTIRFPLTGGTTQDVIGQIGGAAPSLSIQQAIQLVQATGQQGVPCAQFPGQTCQVTGAVQGTGRVTASMTWTLTAASPSVVAAGLIPVAVISTNQGLQGFTCSPVTGTGVGQTVTCNGTTAGNALLNSTVTVVFTRGAIATGTVTAGLAAANVPPLLPPLPPPPPPLPPPPPFPPPGLLQQQMFGQNGDMPMMPGMGQMPSMPSMPSMQDMPMQPSMPMQPARPDPTPTPTPQPQSSTMAPAPPPMRPVQPAEPAVMPAEPAGMPVAPSAPPMPEAPPTGEAEPESEPAALPVEDLGDPMLPAVAEQP